MYARQHAQLFQVLQDIIFQQPANQPSSKLGTQM